MINLLTPFLICQWRNSGGIALSQAKLLLPKDPHSVQADLIQIL